MGLRPFFKYYGGKWRAVPSYAPPAFATIVEPFAGAAGYSLRYADRKVILCDLDPVIAGIWGYLINAKESEILALPDIPEGGTVDDLSIPQEAAWLIGFWLQGGTATPGKTPTSWMRSKVYPGVYWGDNARKRIAYQLGGIRHWEIRNESYQALSVDGPATWFIDPPYQDKGKCYRCSSKDIDFKALGEWCMAREGQAIVCENEGATWLPFEPLASIKSRTGKSKEVVWQSSPKIAGQMGFSFEGNDE